jgi:hypothetical protein
VNATIIHDNDGVRGWIRLHIVEKTFDETSEAFSTEGAFNDLTVNNAIQRESRKDRKSV